MHELNDKSNWVASASAVWSSNLNFPYAIDGAVSATGCCYWHPGSGNSGEWFQVDLQQSHQIAAVHTESRNDGCESFRQRK